MAGNVESQSVCKGCQRVLSALLGCAGGEHAYLADHVIDGQLLMPVTLAISLTSTTDNAFNFLQTVMLYASHRH